jgi:hypothetical protein
LTRDSPEKISSLCITSTPAPCWCSVSSAGKSSKSVT